MNDIIDTLMQSLSKLDTKHEFKALCSDRSQWEKLFAKQLQQTEETLTLLAEYGRLTPIIKKIQGVNLQGNKSEQPWQYVAGISDDEMLEVYQLCLDLSSEQQLEKAAKIASLLGCLNPTVAAFWQMVGSCYWRLGDAKTALAAFLYVAIIGETVVDHHIAVLECLIKLGYIQQALNYYQIAKQFLTQARQWDDLPKLDSAIKGI